VLGGEMSDTYKVAVRWRWAGKGVELSLLGGNKVLSVFEVEADDTVEAKAIALQWLYQGYLGDRGLLSPHFERCVRCKRATGELMEVSPGLFVHEQCELDNIL